MEGRGERYSSPYPGAVHAAVSIAAFCFAILSQFLLWRRLRGSAGGERAVWSRCGTYSLVSGILSIVLLMAFGSSQGSPLYGAVQRAFVAVPWLWIEVMAVVLYRSRRREAGAGAQFQLLRPIGARFRSISGPRPRGRPAPGSP
ncbi:MAG: hypothetical protein JRN06_03780 [Nitrososphaerota archaeon]|nr:hypothetical protein [Nitrososphaerota archaeon]MDG7022908.1 hypothetical protein [Nitrososphaerota archaeon]